MAKYQINLTDLQDAGVSAALADYNLSAMPQIADNATFVQTVVSERMDGFVAKYQVTAEQAKVNVRTFLDALVAKGEPGAAAARADLDKATIKRGGLAAELAAFLGRGDHA